MKKNIGGSHRRSASPNVMASSMLAIPFILQADPMDVLFGGAAPLMPNRHLPVVGPRKAKKGDKKRRLRTKQARRANRK